MPPPAIGRLLLNLLASLAELEGEVLAERVRVGMGAHVGRVSM